MRKKPQRHQPQLPPIPASARHAPRKIPQIKPIPPPIESARNPRFRNQKSEAKLSPIVQNAPITPQDAIQMYSSLLTQFEQTEIRSFPAIYFLGDRAKKLEQTTALKRNRGFDNQDNTYRVRVGDHLAYRFEVLSVFGSGAFGQVVKAFDHKEKVPVAIKIIVNTHQMHEQGRVEAQILAKLNRHECTGVVRAFDFFVFRSHICITFEILGKNLYELSEALQFQPMPLNVVRGYGIQMMTALKNLHALGIIHCDVKPENILVLPNDKTSVKLIDFGSGCFLGHQKFEYIQSRFYRAPEVVLGIEYGPPMDIWSIALVLIEMLIGRPLFPADDEMELMEMIIEIFGTPPRSVLKESKRRGEFFDAQMKLKPGKGPRRKPASLALTKALNSRDTYFIDFMSKCLTWDQKVRMTAAEALEHPWLQSNPPSMLPELKQPNAFS